MHAPSGRTHVVTLIDVVSDGGGAERLAVELLDRLDPDRYERSLVLYGRSLTGWPIDDVPAVRRLRGSGGRVVELHRRGRWDLRAWGPFVTLLRQADVLHAHKFGPNVWATTVGRLRRPPVVVAHEHTWSFEGQPLRKLVDRFVVASGCDMFLAVSQHDRERMIALEKVPPGRVRVLTNGIPPVVVPDGADVRGELGLAPGAQLVVAVGVFRPQKAFPTLVEAFAGVRARVPAAHLVLVGDGPTRPDVESAVARLGLEGAVSLVGLRPDVERYIAAADVAVNSSLFEGASLAVMEYMALGRPIVATAVGATGELLAGGEAGRLVPPGDAAALSEAIVGLLSDPAAAAALGERAARRQREEYDIDVQVRRLEELYAELLAAKGR